jgi:DNA-binding transcriptional MerR regulator
LHIDSSRNLHFAAPPPIYASIEDATLRRLTKGKPMSAFVSATPDATLSPGRVGAPSTAGYPGRPALNVAAVKPGEMAREFSVSLRTLRFYEGTARYYGGGDRLRLQMIQKGKHLGFTLAEISDLIGAKTGSADSDFENKLQPEQIVSQISHLERQRAEIDDAIGRLRETYERLDGPLAPA